MTGPQAEEDNQPPAPRPAEADAIDAALARGDHREARRLAEAALGSADPVVRGAGETLRARFRRDPAIDAVFAATALLMLFLAWHYLGHRP